MLKKKENKICVIIPIFNEDAIIEESFNSIKNQTIKPDRLIYVNDSSTDKTKQKILNLASKIKWVDIIDHISEEIHLPGSKIINAFYYGYEKLDEKYDIICKFDADILLPKNYFESLKKIFRKDKKIGIAGGNLFILKNGKWVYENISAKSHVRGPIKAYRAECFRDIKGLRRSIGWDTVDVLLAQRYGWKIFTDYNLKVKHLRKTGDDYSLKSKLLQGKALYIMRFGLVLSMLSLLKSSFNSLNILKFLFGITGYIISYLKREEFIVTYDEGEYIRKFRWKIIMTKYLKL